MAYTAGASSIVDGGSVGRKGVAFGKGGTASIPGGTSKIPSVLLIPSGQAASQWTDSSGNGNDYAQATGSKQPSVSSLAGSSGVGALLFDGSDDILVSSYVPTGSLGEVWAVWDSDEAEALGDGVVWGTSDEAEAGSPGTGYNRLLCLGSVGDQHPWIIFTPNNDPNTTYYSARGVTIEDDTPYLTRWRSTDSAYKIAHNGSDQSLTHENTGGSDDGDWWDQAANRDNSTVGAQKRSVEANHHAGGVAFLAVWDGLNLSDEEASQWTVFLISACRI